MPDEDAREVLTHVAANLRRLRASAGMSQSSLADRAGVSRRTIIKLEAGEANIGLSGLDDLARALGTTFIDLVAAPSSSRGAINETAWRGADADSVAVLLGSAPAAREAQLWSWSLGAGERYDAQPDPAGWHEMILVTEGRLRLERENGQDELTAGEHVVFSSAQTYSYLNPDQDRVRFVRVVTS